MEIAGVVAVAATTGDSERGGVVFGMLLRFALICIFLRRAARRARMPWTTVGACQLQLLPERFVDMLLTFEYDLPVLRFHPVHSPFFYARALGSLVNGYLFGRRLIVIFKNSL